MERSQHQTRGRTRTPGTHASGRLQSVRKTSGETLWHLLIRTTEHQVQRRAGKAIAGQPSRLEILSVATAFVSARRYLVGGQRETGRDEAKASGHPD